METLNNTVLIIEDDYGLNELISEKIQAKSYSTNPVSCGIEAINWLKSNIPFLIIIDYSLSDMTATDFINQLISQGTHLPPFIVATGQGNERIAVEMMKLGARDYIIKDTNFLELMPIVVERVAKEIKNEEKLKQAEKELFESEEKYRILIENSGIGISFFDLEGSLIFLNHKASQNLGGSQEDFIGKSYLEILGEANGAIYFSRIQETAASEDSLEYEDVFHTNSGDLWFLSNFAKIQNADNETIGIQILAHDITERKKAEAALIKKMQELENMNKFMINREVRMSELKKEINDLLESSGKQKKYF